MKSTAASSELMALVPPRRDTLQQRVYSELRRALMRGEFTPGRSLTIRALAHALHTSSMPVREALRQLVTERALEMLPNRSFGVPQLSPERFHDLLRVRTEIEGFAVAEAASRITKAQLERVEEINAEMRAASKGGDRLRFISCNQEFHFAIYAAAGSGTLIPLIETLWLQAGPYIGCIYGEDLDPIVNLSHHEGLLRALRRRDAAKSRAMLIQDISSPADRVIEIATARFKQQGALSTRKSSIRRAERRGFRSSADSGSRTKEV